LSALLLVLARVFAQEQIDNIVVISITIRSVEQASLPCFIFVIQIYRMLKMRFQKGRYEVNPSSFSRFEKKLVSVLPIS
jgi:hypothetical protein